MENIDLYFIKLIYMTNKFKIIIYVYLIPNFVFVAYSNVI